MSILGGIERVLALKMNYLADNTDNKVYFITSDQKNNNFSYPLSPKIIHIDLGGIRFFSIYKNEYPLKFLNIYIFERDFKLRLAKTIKDIKPHIIVGNTTFMASLILKLNIKSKIIIESHLAKSSILKGDYTKSTFNVINYLKRRYDYYYCKRIKLCDTLVLLTKADYDAWKEIEKRVLIPNPIVIFPTRINEINSKRIICVGRLYFEKGYDMLIKAWKKLANKYNDWGIDIYGSGYMRNELNKIICDEGLDKSINIHQATSDIYEKYCESEFLVLSSRAEGFALVLAENMECGRPCVAFNCPSGPDEIITDGIDGLIAKNGDIDDLADKIEWMITHERERRIMGIKASLSTKKYSIEPIMKQWINLFNKLYNE